MMRKVINIVTGLLFTAFTAYHIFSFAQIEINRFGRLLGIVVLMKSRNPVMAAPLRVLSIRISFYPEAAERKLKRREDPRSERSTRILLYPEEKELFPKGMKNPRSVRLIRISYYNLIMRGRFPSAA